MTNKLKEVLESPNDKLIAFHLDDTLCKGRFWEKDPEPMPEMIKLVWKLYIGGAHIIIFTARQIKYTSLTYAWLDKHEVPYHGLMIGRKPGADLYVDDKSIRPEELIEFFKKDETKKISKKHEKVYSQKEKSD